MITTKELAEILKYEVSTITRWAAKGDIPSVKVGKGYRFELEEVIAALKNK